MPLSPHISFERLICNWEIPQRCRKRATVWMDGVVYCEEHRVKVHPMFYQMVRQIIYR